MEEPWVLVVGEPFSDKLAKWTDDTVSQSAGKSFISIQTQRETALEDNAAKRAV